MSHTMPLSRTHPGAEFTVTDIRAGGALARRLLLLGLWEDTRWRVLDHRLDGSMVIAREAQRLTLRPDEANCILGLPA